jgi:hypothetical protein
MIVDQPRQNSPAPKVDHPGFRTGQRHHLFVGANGKEATVADRHGSRGRVCTIERGEQATMQDQVGGRRGFGHVRDSGSESALDCAAGACRPGRRPNSHCCDFFGEV